MPALLTSIRIQLLRMVATPGADGAALRRHALRWSLCRWRAAVDPKAAGLPVRRRRGRGLSRADVAELAGLSLTWYTRLESAPADHSCSPRAVDRIADALRLEPPDRAILHVLASPEAFRSFRLLCSEGLAHVA